jgi:hypothetical protein
MMTFVLFLMQIEARGVQRHVTEIVAHRAQVDLAGLCLDKDSESNKCRYDEEYSCDQRVELLGGSLRDAPVLHLAFDDHVQELDAAKNDACTTKILETQH